MVEPIQQRFEGIGNVRVVHEPAEFSIAFPRDDNFHLETVTVQAPAFVRFWQVRQQVRGLELKCLS